MTLKNIIACDVVMSTICNRCANLIKERYGLIIDVCSIPQDDADVYELMSTDTSSDVFGLRSHEYHRLISQIRPTEIRHIEALHAMSTRLMFRKFAEYIKNKENSESAAITSYQCFWLKTHYPNEYRDALVPLVNTDE